jgi:hypothetical protein
VPHNYDIRKIKDYTACLKIAVTVLVALIYKSNS